MSAQTAAQQEARHRTKIVSVAVPDINNFEPGHTDGDTDFDGNGPLVSITADVKRKGSLLILDVYAFFQETKSDWTTFEGNFQQTFYDVSLQHPGWRIQSIQGKMHQTYETVLTGYGQHTISPFGTSDFVKSMVLVGDSDGGAFGGDDKPRIVSLAFNEIELRLVK
jgi:hypothetical protein